MHAINRRYTKFPNSNISKGSQLATTPYSVHCFLSSAEPTCSAQVPVLFGHVSLGRQLGNHGPHPVGFSSLRVCSPVLPEYKLPHIFFPVPNANNQYSMSTQSFSHLVQECPRTCHVPHVQKYCQHFYKMAKMKHS